MKNFKFVPTEDINSYETKILLQLLYEVLNMKFSEEDIPNVVKKYFKEKL